MKCRTLVLAIVCVVLGYIAGVVRDHAASGAPVPASGTPRYAISGYGTESNNGCYVIDTMTGQLWHVGSQGKINPIGVPSMPKSE